MSQKLFNRSPDLQRLHDEGYSVEIRGGLLLVNQVPYVSAGKQVRTGTLVSSLALSGDATRKPETHVVHFIGEYPCNADGQPLSKIRHGSGKFDLGLGLTAQHSFSSKPDTGYADYFHKMSTYATILSGPAAVLKPEVSPRVFQTLKPDDEKCPFRYLDTASTRAGLGELASKLSREHVAIIGLGGTGSYVLDLVAKTQVQEIRLFDSDEFLQHNAFRAPGAPSVEELRTSPSKVERFGSLYSNMHRGIVTHAVKLNSSNLALLEGVTFAFVCIDGGEEKRSIFEKLESMEVPFIDAGMGLELVDGSLGGIVRVTSSTSLQRRHVYSGLVSFAGGGDNLYSSNIQVADLNALNAAQAVIKWKKIRGFYRDLEGEHHSTYTTDGNMLLNSECTACGT